MKGSCLTNIYDIPNLVLIAFNRPDLLKEQLSVVRAHFKGRIFAIIDGPRESKADEKFLVDEVVTLIEELGKDFEVTINRSSKNLGCYHRIKSGLDWVFSRVESAIILEDDCIPSPQFFDFAKNSLKRYACDERVFSISGTNLFVESCQSEKEHFFTRYPNCWGWATWSRAWRCYINDQEAWDKIRASSEFRHSFQSIRSFIYWRHIFDNTFKGEINSWFYRWVLTSWTHEGLTVVPSVNLISNVGDGKRSTHTSHSIFMRRKVGVLENMVMEPTTVSSYPVYDKKIEDTMYSKSLYNRFKWAISLLTKHILLQ